MLVGRSSVCFLFSFGVGGVVNHPLEECTVDNESHRLSPMAIVVVLLDTPMANPHNDNVSVQIDLWGVEYNPMLPLSLRQIRPLIGRGGGVSLDIPCHGGPLLYWVMVEEKKKEKGRTKRVWWGWRVVRGVQDREWFDRVEFLAGCPWCECCCWWQ